MTAKAYYITTLADWQRHAARFANSHFVVLDAPNMQNSVGAQQEVPPGRRRVEPGGSDVPAPEASPRIFALIEADEGVHLSLEDEPAFEALPHPLAQKPVSAAAQAALAPHGVLPGATIFDAAEILARVHPLLKHRVF